MMTRPPVYTMLNVPTVTSYPSIKCLQWSTDGQICFTSKNAAYILTPEHGINLDLTPTLKTRKDSGDGIPPVAWFRTIIPFDKSDALRWPEYSQAWGSASLGSIDVALCSVAFSPSTLSPDSGCIFAALSSNMDLSLWTASKNFLKGEWIKITDVTPFLVEAFLCEEAVPSQTSRVLKAQITSVTWSQQADFGLVPRPPVDGSLLVTGSRAGTLTFLRPANARYKQNKTVELLRTISVSDKWITHIGISSWTTIMPGSSEAYLSYAASDGSIGLVKIAQILTTATQGPAQTELVLTLDHNAPLVCPADNKGITAISWQDIPDKGWILAYCKPGVLHLFSPPTSSLPWTGHRALCLQTIKLSVGSSPLHPPSGIQYIARLDILVLSLFDGSIHVVHNVSSDPTLTPPLNGDLVTSCSLSTAVRSVFLQVEQEMDFRDMNRITGMVLYDGEATLIWMQEAARPADFSYKHDAKQNSTLVVSRVWDDVSDEALLGDISRVVNNARAGRSPLLILRPLLFRLGEKHRLSRLRTRILDVLKLTGDDHSLRVAVPPFTSLTPETRTAFRLSLSQHLFGWDVLLSLRLRLGLADFTCRYAENDVTQNECAEVAQNLLATLSHRVLRTIIRHLTAAVDILNANDVPFVLRMVVQSMLEGSPPDLSTEGNHLSRMTQAAVFHGQQEAANSFSERCPACQVEVPLEDITAAVCSNGHTWARCSITTFILSTPLVRTCVGCHRKAFLPLSTPNVPASGWLPPVAQGWVVEELLEAVNRCLFCNNSFVNLL